MLTFHKECADVFILAGFFGPWRWRQHVPSAFLYHITL